MRIYLEEGEKEFTAGIPELGLQTKASTCDQALQEIIKKRSEAFQLLSELGINPPSFCTQNTFMGSRSKLIIFFGTILAKAVLQIIVVVFLASVLFRVSFPLIFQEAKSYLMIPENQELIRNCLELLQKE